jgi:hypothetical protein
MEYSIGDEVQVYIPKADDPDHQYHGEVGEIVDVLDDQLSELSGNPSRGELYTIKFEDTELATADFRYDDLEKPD